MNSLFYSMPEIDQIYVVDCQCPNAENILFKESL